MSNLLKLEISAENQAQADTILNALLGARLVTGGQFVHAPARFLWKRQITDMDYITVTSFTTAQHKSAIIASVKATSAEEVPMIVFTPFEANPELESWIEETVA